MTIQSSTSRATYAGDNVSTVFPVPFLFFANVDITAVKTAAGGAVTTLVLNVDYTLTGAGIPSGGTLTKTTALLTGETLGIFLDPPRTQLSHYLTNDIFPAATLETNIDRSVQISQRLYDLISRAIRAPDSDNNPQLTLPSAIARALKYITFDASGNLSLATSLPSGTLSQASIAAFLYPQTTPEGAVPVTPTIFVPTLHIDIERYGGVADNLTDNAAAMTRAMSVLTQKGGGTLLFPSAGTYKTSGALLMPGKARFQGDGMQASFLQYTGTGTFITFTSTGGTNDIEDMAIFGTGKLGTGIQFGDAVSFAGLCNLRRYYVSGFATGIRMGGALWATIEDGRIQNNTVGIDFNASFASGHCNVVEISRNQISFNDHEGVAASNVPVRNQNIAFRGGSIEQNGATDLTRYQLVTGAVEQLTIDNVYFEYAAGGTKPNGVNLNGASNFAIRESFFNTLTTAIFATSANNGTIDTCRFIGTITNDFNLTGGGNVHDIEISNTNTLSGVANIVAGTNVVLYTAARAQQIATTIAWTPTIRGASVAGTPTYTAQTATYSKVGNLVFFQVRVSISAKTGMSGAISIEGLPLTSATQAGSSATFAAEYSGVTVSGGNTYLYAELANNSTSILLMQGGSTSNAQLADTNIAAATTVVISGCYQTTS